jgi:hypothetical protein
MKSNSKKGEINGDKTKNLKKGEILKGKERKQMRWAMGGKGGEPTEGEEKDRKSLDS